jgi:hypothetical protein
MPVDTTSSMIFGYAVILGVLALYVITLYVRIKQVKQHHRKE